MRLQPKAPVNFNGNHKAADSILRKVGRA
jgi:hypothetical protein